eukprot:m.351388 g.351388  ORF g.351388 m.351388 type:complete len:79 (-) comp16238_c0_seq1:299-535(-)
MRLMNASVCTAPMRLVDKPMALKANYKSLRQDALEGDQSILWKLVAGEFEDEVESGCYFYVHGCGNVAREKGGNTTVL